MDERPEDLVALQALLDDSYARAGSHLREIHTDAARLDADRLVETLEGMQVFVVATVTADGRPLTGPVDTFLHRGRVIFGTSADAVRHRNLTHSPWISATHTRGEDLVVTVHGRAVPVDPDGDDGGALGQLLRRWYGEGWNEWGRPSPYWAIVADRLFAADMTVLRA